MTDSSNFFSIDVRHVSKSYNDGKITAVEDVSFRVNKGEIFGLIGPDGAGKTTVFRILTTLLKPDKGEAFVDSIDVMKDFRAIRERVGYMPGRFSLYQDLSVEENLNFFATVFRTTIKENYHLISEIYRHIEPFKDRKAGALSGGMKQKLALCCALIHKPSVLFLDEPTTGVDPVSRKEFWGMLKNLKSQGITILVSTPYMDEATLCERIALMTEGRILKIDTPQNMISRFDKSLWSVQSKDMFKLLKDLRQYPEINTCFAFGDTHHITFKEETNPVAALESYLHEKGHADINIHRTEPKIEDCYMNIDLKKETA